MEDSEVITHNNSLQEDSEVITVISTSSLPENSVEITSTEAEPVRGNSLYIAESVEVFSTDDSIICLDEEETSADLYPNDDIPLNLSTNTLPVVIPFASDLSESPSISCSNSNDDDFSIIFERKAPPLEVEILENYTSPITQTKKKHRNAPYLRTNDQSECHNSNQQEAAEQTNPSIDDSISIIDASSRVSHVSPSLNQSNLLNSLRNAVLDSAEKKKRKIQCGVCFDGPDEIEASGKSVVSTVCGHIFCDDCIKVSIKSFKHCPQCRKKLTMKQFHVIYV